MSRIVAFPKANRPKDPPAAPAAAQVLTAVSLSEILAEGGAGAAAAGFVLAQLARRAGPVLWIQDRMSRQEGGRPYLAGMGALRPLWLLQVARATDVLIAAEEGLRCAALSAVVAEVWGDPPALSFTATKRLALRAEATGVPCWLIRQAGQANLSAARDRWRLGSLPAAAHPDDPRAPGDPRWRIDLFRSRDKQAGLWVACHDRAADRLDLSAAVRDGALAAPGDAAGEHAGG